jgi:hypothetical protein
VEIYRAWHQPGGTLDYGTVPISTVMADGSGGFSLDVPGVEAGTWVAATVTDNDGNTSEFGPAARVGAGIIQCGATELAPGWNYAPFFGPNATQLGDSFPTSGSGAGHVTAIYRLVNGTSTFDRWIAGAGFANTLLTLEPGESYFFLADAELALPGGFALTAPFPVSLLPGWNSIVYIGGEGDYRDAFGPAGTVILDTFRFDSSGWRPGWQNIGLPETPEWARDFTTIAPCQSYQVLATGTGTIFPLQP